MCRLKKNRFPEKKNIFNTSKKSYELFQRILFSISLTFFYAPIFMKLFLTCYRWFKGRNKEKSEQNFRKNCCLHFFIILLCWMGFALYYPVLVPQANWLSDITGKGVLLVPGFQKILNSHPKKIFAIFLYCFLKIFWNV